MTSLRLQERMAWLAIATATACATSEERAPESPATQLSDENRERGALTEARMKTRQSRVYCGPPPGRPFKTSPCCQFPEGVPAEVMSAVVRVRVHLEDGGAPSRVDVLDDPGYGFAQEAIICLMDTEFTPDVESPLTLKYRFVR